MPKYTHLDFSLMAGMIVDGHKSPLGDFNGFIITGKLGRGKSSYSIKGMRDVFQMLNPKLTMGEAYELAIQSMHFEVAPFLTRIRDKQREIRERLPKIDWTKRIPVITLDDASLYVGADLYMKDKALYSAFENSMTTIRTAASSVLITAPHHLALTKCLREYYSWNVVKITKYDAYRREAKIMEWYEKKNSKLGLREVCTDEFPVRIPNAFYSKYLAPRIDMAGKKEEKDLATSRERVLEKAGAEPIKEAAEEVLVPKRDQRKKKIKGEQQSRAPNSDRRKRISDIRRELEA